MIPFSSLISDSGVVTAFVKGRPYTFAPDNPNYEKVKKAIEEKNFDEIARLGSLPKAVESYGGGNIKVEGGVVKYKGRELHNSLTKRILNLMKENWPFASMLKFLDNLMQNPSKHAVDELYNFLVHRNLPITENGCFLAYKAVREDYMDWHSNSVRNMVGDVPPPFERNEVDDDWRKDCSSGYHVGAIEYVTGFYAEQPRHVMIVEVNPKDVVSVPTGECSKCRTCAYTVVGEMDGELLAQVYKTTHSSYTPSTPTPTPTPSWGSTSSMSSNDDDEDDDDYDVDDEDDDEDDDD
jgi:hypothetical protein